MRRFVRACKPGHLAYIWFSPQRRPFFLNSAHDLIRGQIPGKEMSAIRGRMPDLYASFVQQAANEPKRHRPGFPWAAQAEIKPHCVDDAPQTNVILMTFVDQAFQHIIRGHMVLPSVNELDFLNGDRAFHPDWLATRHQDVID
jgi:hypothetical protein